MEKLSVSIICTNEEKNIGECIRSVLWADEVIVVDGFSTDKTIQIASIFNVKIYQNKWEGFAKQREFTLSKCSNEWVFSIDADERCTPELEKEIREIISSDSKINGYKIPRKSFFLGKWVKYCGWYPGLQLRLFRKSSVKVAGRLVHECYLLDGEPGNLKNDLMHFTVQSISEYMERVNHYSTLRSMEKFERGNIKFLNIFFKPIASFIQVYFFKRGFMDGITGLMVVNFHIITNILTIMKIWEMQNTRK